MSDPAKLLALQTAVPAHVLRQEDLVPAAVGLFSDSERSIGAHRLAPIFANTQIEQRYSCVPLDWYLKPHGFGERNALFLQNAEDLLTGVAEQCLAEAGLAAEEIDVLVTVSSTGIATPSLDARLINRLPFRHKVQRLPIFGLGCAGGVLGLARGAAMAQAQPGAKVMVLVVELCGLTFRHADRSKSNVIAAALFGDGAAGAILSTEGDGHAFTAFGEHTWPDSLRVMGWDVGDDGLSVLFSRDIPHHVRDAFGQATDEFLSAHGMSLGDVDVFVPHPGGAKVLDALEEVLELAPGGLREARDVLRRYGNMSAVTVLFVLTEALRHANSEQKRYLLTSLGPGFTGAFALLEAA